MRPVVLAFVLVLVAGQARAQDAVGDHGAMRAHVEIAAARFDLPIALIETVITAESGGRTRAVSSAGAMGLMQLMPGTWTDLRARLGLGADPFDPADNILAGTAYLRQLRDRYGAPGFLAAYNAGPGRYEASLAGRPLPLETQLYVARIVARAGVINAPAAAWRAVGLFPSVWSSGLGRTLPDDLGTAPARAQEGLFVTRRPPKR